MLQVENMVKKMWFPPFTPHPHPPSAELWCVFGTTAIHLKCHVMNAVPVGLIYFSEHFELS